MADEKILIEIKVDNEAAVTQLEEQNKEIDKLEKSQKDLAKQGQKNSLIYQQQTQKLSKLRSERKQNLKSISSESGSLNQLRAELAKLTTERNKLSDVNGKNSEEFTRLNSDILSLNESISKAEQSGGDFRRNVGNYGDALKDAASQSGVFGGALDSVGQIIKLNPIGLLISGLVALVAAFGKTEKGAKFFAIVGEVINQLFNELVGLLGSVGTALTDLNFEDIGNSIKTYLVDQVKLVIKGFGLLGDAFVKLFDGDFSGAIDSAGEGLKTLYIEANPLAQVISGTTKAVVEFTEKVIENTSATIENASARFELERSIGAQQVAISGLIQEEEKLNKVADDSTLSLNEQKKANEDYEEALNKRLASEKKLLEDQQKLIQTDLDIKRSQGLDVVDLQQQAADKQVEINQKNTEQQQANYDQQQRDRQINQDQWEQDLDFVIDIGTRRADNLLKQGLDDSAALEQYKDAITGVQQGIINSFEESGLTEEEFRRLLGIRDPEELAESIRQLDELSEIENNRLKEGLNEFLITEQDKLDATIEYEAQRNATREKYAEEEKKRQKAVASAGVNLASDVLSSVSQFLEQGSKEQKAFAIADATVNTYKGITNALANVPAPFNIPAAALVGAKGFAAVSSIAQTGTSSISTGGNFGGGGGGQTQAQPQVDTNPIDQQLAQQEALIAATGNIGMSVSVTEINNVQQDVQLSEQTATI